MIGVARQLAAARAAASEGIPPVRGPAVVTDAMVRAGRAVHGHILSAEAVAEVYLAMAAARSPQQQET